MSRNRVIYQSEALFVSKEINSTSRADHSQLRRVQSANYSFNVSRTDVNQFGQLSRIDSLILEAPTVSADISYYLTDGYNEEVLNFANSDLNVGFVSGQISSTSGQNLYIMTAGEGKDANFGTGTFGAIGIGNAYVTDYSFEASVGSFPTVNISFEGSNINASAGVTGTSDGFSGNFTGAGILPQSGTPIANQTLGNGIQIRPANPETDEGSISALRPSDITFDLAAANGDTIATIDGTNNGGHIQSVSLSIPLSRTPIEKLGTRFPFARTVDFPITPTLSVSAIVNETEQKSLTNIVADDGFIPSAQITIKDVNGNKAAIYKLTNLKLDSESFSSSIGPNKTVDLTFSLSIGGPDDLENNVFFSGANTDAKFALQPVVIYDGGLTSEETVTINGVTIASGDAGKTVGYLHGDSSRAFVTTYIGSQDLDLASVGGGTISGNAGLSGALGITGLSGQATSLVFSPNNASLSATISGSVSLS